MLLRQLFTPEMPSTSLVRVSRVSRVSGVCPARVGGKTRHLAPARVREKHCLLARVSRETLAARSCQRETLAARLCQRETLAARSCQQGNTVCSPVSAGRHRSVSPVTYNRSRNVTWLWRETKDRHIASDHISHNGPHSIDGFNNIFGYIMAAVSESVIGFVMLVIVDLLL